jgi:hypothetical protein
LSRQTLDAVYGQTLKVAASMPATAQYRKQLEERVQQQQKLLNEVSSHHTEKERRFCGSAFAGRERV